MIMGIPAGEKSDVILSPEFLRRLARLKLETRTILGGVMKGEKRSRRYGTSVEFADYRDYHRGDDLRYLDWNIYARLERFFLKLFHEEEDLTVHILLDQSASMATGNPSKLLHARQLAAALAYIALTNHDRMAVTPFSDILGKGTRFLRGRAHIATVLSHINGLETGSRTNFAESMKEFTLRYRQKGLVFVISDFFDPVNLEAGLKRLSNSGHELMLIQVLDKTELEPDIRGDWALTDNETGDVVEVSVSPKLIADYKRRILGYLNELKDTSRKIGAGYIVTTTGTPVEEFILKELVHGSCVRFQG